MALRIRDDMGRDVVLGREVKRVVSLVPSDTYSLFALGAGDRLVGRTRFCVEPAGALEDVPVVGGTKDVDPDAVADLAPDLILANQEENARAPLEALAGRRLPLLVSFPIRVADGLTHLARLARALGVAREPAAVELIRRGYAELRADGEIAAARADMPRAFVPIWKDPWMTMNQDAFASDLLLQAGAENAFADRERRYPLAADLGRRSPIAADQAARRDRRYPRVTAEEIAARAPDLVLLPDEPYAFGAADQGELAALDIPAARRGAIELCDGKDLFWYGARAIEALPRLRALIARLAGLEA
jgi:ABC-type Fe3+-hydroxamate transport system substrate-binding protein